MILDTIVPIFCHVGIIFHNNYTIGYENIIEIMGTPKIQKPPEPRSVLDNPRAAIEEFDPQERQASMNRLDCFVTEPSQKDAALIVAAGYLEQPDFFDLSFSTRFAAIRLFGLTTSHADQFGDVVLSVFQKETHPVLKTIEARILIGYGHKEAIPVLVESLSSKTNYPFIEQYPLWEVARQTLPYYTSADFDLSISRSPCVTQDSWLAWWEDNQEKLIWDDTSNKYVIIEDTSE